MLDDAVAHVEYVVSGGRTVEAISFLFEVLSRPLNAALVAGGALVVTVVILGYLWYRPFGTDVDALRAALAEYEEFLPWMLRLSVGLPLVGAGFAGYFFSPAVHVEVRLVQVAVGFLLLFGLATRAVAAIGLLIYLAGLVGNPNLLLASEYVGGFLAILLLGSGRPSADHLLQRVAEEAGSVYGRVDPVHPIVSWFRNRFDPYRQYAPTMLRLGLGANFAFLGVYEKLANPGLALQAVAKYDLTHVVPVDPGLWVIGAGLTEFAVGALLVLGLFTRGTAAVGFLMLTLTLFGLPDDPVLAHVTLFGMTSALFVTGSGPWSLDERLSEMFEAIRRPSVAVR